MALVTSAGHDNIMMGNTTPAFYLLMDFVRRKEQNGIGDTDTGQFDGFGELCGFTHPRFGEVA